MTLLVFTGPTLSPAEASRLYPNIVFEGPAACGDVYRATTRPVAALGIIDGYFEHRLPVWHKEVLWALRCGIRVYGASSLGALRAAELAPFGMIGVGRIYEAVQSGAITDDDEVALSHEPAERQYKPCSEPLVNLRATLQRAQDEGVIGAATYDLLLREAKALFYPERTYAAVLGRARHHDVAHVELVALERWLSEGHRVDQKRLDAVALLERMQRDRDLAAGAPPAAPEFAFAYTEAWHELRTQLDRQARSSRGSEPAERRRRRR